MRTGRNYRNPNTNEELVPFYDYKGAAILTDLLQHEKTLKDSGNLYKNKHFEIIIGDKSKRLGISRRIYNRYLREFIQDRILQKRKLGKLKLDYYFLDRDQLGMMLRGELL